MEGALDLSPGELESLVFHQIRPLFSLASGPLRTQRIGHSELRIKYIPHIEVWQRPSRWGLLCKET